MKLPEIINFPAYTKFEIKTPTDSKVVDIKGAKSTAIKKLITLLGMPGEAGYALRKNGKTSYSGQYDFNIEVKVLEEVEPESLTAEQYLKRVKQKQEHDNDKAAVEDEGQDSEDLIK